MRIVKNAWTRHAASYIPSGPLSSSEKTDSSCVRQINVQFYSEKHKMIGQRESFKRMSGYANEENFLRVVNDKTNNRNIEVKCV